MIYFVIYHNETTRYLGNHPGQRKVKTHFTSEAAAKAALTRAVNATKIVRDDFSIAELVHFRTNIEKKETRRNFMPPHNTFEVNVNADYCSCPSSESYWSS